MWQKFDEADWLAFNGVEKFADGSEPLVRYDLKITYVEYTLEAVAIIDANGAVVEPVTDEGETFGIFKMDLGANAFLFAAATETVWTPAELTDFGFTWETW